MVINHYGTLTRVHTREDNSIVFFLILHPLDKKKNDNFFKSFLFSSVWITDERKLHSYTLHVWCDAIYIIHHRDNNRSNTTERQVDASFFNWPNENLLCKLLFFQPSLAIEIFNFLKMFTSRHLTTVFRDK